ncbi:MAG: hypothetical protein ACLGJC_16420 [Alphaproteobacteria bacterium]
MLKTRSEIERIKDECLSMVTKRALLSGSASAVPIPMADAVTDISILLEMIPEINRRFGLSPEQIGSLTPAQQAIVYSIIKRVGTSLAGKAITRAMITQSLKSVAGRIGVKQVAKFVPFIGTAISATVGFAAMKYVGNRHVEDCADICLRLLNSHELREISG